MRPWSGPWGRRRARGDPPPIPPAAEPEAPAETALAETALAGGPRQFPCEACGAQLTFAPGTELLKCDHCGHENPVPESNAVIEELDFRSAIAGGAAADEVEQSDVVSCESCGAEVTLDPKVHSDRCPFCDSALVQEVRRAPHLKPKSLLPFRVDGEEARTAFREWLRRLWFAPGNLKAYARTDGGLTGIYTPYWTFDADTRSRYTGLRGRVRIIVVGRGKNRRTRTRVSWTPVSGRVGRFFNDVLVLASETLPRKLTEKLEPWDLENLVPYDEAYLAGFRSEMYRIGLEPAFDDAKRRMETTIRTDIRRDIGGDRQRITSMTVRYDAITYKHLLLPIWLAAYRYRDKTYRFVVNARTGEVHGERPYSWLKIALAALAAGAIAAGLLWFFQGS